MLSRVGKFFDDLNSTTAPPERGAVAPLDWVREATFEEVKELLAGLGVLKVPALGTPGEAIVNRLLAQLLRGWQVPGQRGERPLLSAELRERIVLAYKHLGNAVRERYLLLSWLVASRQGDDLAALAELLATDPPLAAGASAAVLAALVTHDDYDPAPLFPRLFAGLGYPDLATAILDLANFLTREQRLPRHPAHSRANQLAELLGTLTQRLAQLETRPALNSEAAEPLAHTVAESVALAVALCDALALVGDIRVADQLRQAMALGHRRLRTEAAAALARLGDAAGEEGLVNLSHEPVARLRVLAYATELGILEKIPAAFRTPTAQAEAELVSWLAEPAQFGLPPQECELFHSCEKYWPGFDDAMACYLFRYTYRLGGGSFSNLGIAGPLAHTFRADLGDLSPDDIYAAFAGWQAEHEEIFELDVARGNELEGVEIARLQRRLHDAGFESIEPLSLGYFFGDRALVARATREDRPGLAVVDALEISFHATGKSARPLGPTEAYCIYKGRKLLRTFNAGESSAHEEA